MQRIVTKQDDLPRNFAPPLSHVDTLTQPDVLRRLEEMMTSEKSVPTTQSAQRRDQELDRRYGEIGISAVAAAVRYHSASSDPAPAQHDERSDKAA